jgi:hypothetical protein
MITRRVRICFILFPPLSEAGGADPRRFFVCDTERLSNRKCRLIHPGRTGPLPDRPFPSSHPDHELDFQAKQEQDDHQENEDIAHPLFLLK